MCINQNKKFLLVFITRIQGIINFYPNRSSEAPLNFIAGWEKEIFTEMRQRCNPQVYV
jgi:hypothetical protein